MTRVLKVTTVQSEHSERPAATPVIREALSIKPIEIEHLWPGMLYIGKPTLVVGDPGLFKSGLALDAAARTSRGSTWPLGAKNAKAGDVLICSAEDDPADTIIPRLIAAGADLSRISFLEGVCEIDEEGRPTNRSLALDRHLDHLKGIAAGKAGELRLLIIDPIAAFLGNTDSHKNSEVRTVIAGLASIAAEYRFAVLIVSHLNKGAQTSAIYRISGSLAFVAAARAAFAVVRDPEKPDRRLLLPVKNNLAADTSGYSFQINVADNGAPYVAWSDEAVTEQTADAVLGGTMTAREGAVSARVVEVVDWLKDQLSEEARPAAEMWRSSESRGFSKRDVERAKKHVGVRASIKGFGGAWHWELPRRYQ